ncbi:MAG: hypothetical protein LBQ20_02770 [Rhodanobacter sp.]|jgi:hypothetical protein|nr:hypothetical protein [Rhodanobacter sp.]
MVDMGGMINSFSHFSLHMCAGEDVVFDCRHAIGFEDYSGGNQKSGVRLVEFFNINLNKSKKIKSHSLLDFYYKFRDIEIDGFSASNIHDLDFSKTIDGYFSAMFNIDRGINGLKARIISSWLHGFSDIDWKNFDTPEKKRAWLGACLSWRSIINKTLDVNESKIITMPGDSIFCEEDFFCFLGKAVCGYRGYLGQDLDGFEKELSELSYNHGIKLKLKIEKIKFLRKIPFFTNLFERHVQDILENNDGNLLTST